MSVLSLKHACNRGSAQLALLYSRASPPLRGDSSVRERARAIQRELRERSDQLDFVGVDIAALGSLYAGVSAVLGPWSMCLLLPNG